MDELISPGARLEKCEARFPGTHSPHPTLEFESARGPSITPTLHEAAPTHTKCITRSTDTEEVSIGRTSISAVNPCV